MNINILRELLKESVKKAFKEEQGSQVNIIKQELRSLVDSLRDNGITENDDRYIRVEADKNDPHIIHYSLPPDIAFLYNYWREKEYNEDVCY